MSGGWPLLLCLITIECLSSPDGTRPLPCIPIQVPRDRYPAALLLLLLILGAPKLSLSLGCAYGYAYAKGYLEVLKPKPALVARCEAASALACVTSDSTFVSAERSLGASAFTVSGGDWADPENPSAVQRGFGTMLAEARQAAFPPEPPGGQGRVLGRARGRAPRADDADAAFTQRTARGNRGRSRRRRASVAPERRLLGRLAPSPLGGFGSPPPGRVAASSRRQSASCAWPHLRPLCSSSPPRRARSGCARPPTFCSFSSSAASRPAACLFASFRRPRRAGLSSRRRRGPAALSWARPTLRSTCCLVRCRLD